MHSPALSPLLVDTAGRLLACNAADLSTYEIVGSCCDGPNRPCDLIGCRLATPQQQAQSRRADLIPWLLVAFLALMAVACRPSRLPAERAEPSKHAFTAARSLTDTCTHA